MPERNRVYILDHTNIALPSDKSCGIYLTYIEHHCSSGQLLSDNMGVPIMLEHLRRT